MNARPSLVLLVALSSTAVAGPFDQLNTDLLREAAQGRPLAGLSMADAAKARLLPNTDAPCVVVRTGDGNWSKVLVSWQFKKVDDKPLPVVLIERFVTFSSQGQDVSQATDKDVMLFAGFAYDFDFGQVVPEAVGGDLVFHRDGSLKPVGKAELFLLDGSTFKDDPAVAQPADHEGVLPEDYAGRWTVHADGRWGGTWSLKMTEAGACTGEFLSKETGSLYKVSGKVALGQPHRIKLAAELANVTQLFDAYLWTSDKSKMAGTMTMAGKTFGFYAVREASPPGQR